MVRALLILFCLALHPVFAAPKLLVGIAGGTGSGKTTLAQQILDAFPSDAILISQDAYYKDLSHLTHEERARANFDHPNSLDFKLLKEHLFTLKNNRAIEEPIYNFHTHSREKATKLIEPASLVIVEGILLFAAEEVRDLFDVKIFVDTDDDVRVLRRIERDIKERSRQFDNIKEQYLTTVKPMHDQFVEPSKRYADVIIPEGRNNQVALDFILAKLGQTLQTR